MSFQFTRRGGDRIEVEQALVSEETGREHEALGGNEQSREGGAFEGRHTKMMR